MSLNTVNLTIRSTIKKIDEINFRCPLSWTIYQLKTFVALNHKQGQEYFKPAKTTLYFGGSPLKDNDTLFDTLINKQLKLHYTFIAKFSPGLEAEENSKQNVEEDTEKSRILNEYSKIFPNQNESYEKRTNIKDLGYITKLPIMKETISKQLIKKESLDDGLINNAQQQQGGGNLENIIDDEANFGNQYIIKLVIRILITFFLFGSYFQGVVYYVFIAVLGIYLLIKLSQRKFKQRQQQPQRNQQNQPRPGVPNVEAAGQNNNQEEQVNLQNQQNQQNQLKPNLFNKIKELAICFVSSFYPSWDVNIYIQNNQVEQPNNPPVLQEGGNTGMNLENINNDVIQNNNQEIQVGEVYPATESTQKDTQKPDLTQEKLSSQPQTVENSS